ncbi:MAG TPA: cyclic dehypoxanthinyl futalosine synthase [Planctomycetota bacterium]|nr:cyclic dehypoxanthinyl futalosine synthase [Planctomycetota bacterium]
MTSAAPNSSLERAVDRAATGERLSGADAAALLRDADLATLGSLADGMRWRLHPAPVVTYIVDRNVNPTNVCITDCGFCAFYRRPGQEGAYVLERETIYRKIDELLAIGGVLVLMQGGHHPYLKVDWYAELLRDLKSRYPKLHLHALSPPEVDHLAKLEKTDVGTVIDRLRDAGLDSIPGGGAEILVDRVRKAIAPKKCSSAEWLEVMRQAHRRGLRTTATMMFGTVETLEERVEHLLRLRELQDEHGGFTAFACWNYQPRGTPMGEKLGTLATPADYFRTVAVARLVLDNVRSIQASYVTQGIAGAQISLRFGVNDFGGGMMEENVVSAAGCKRLTTLDEIERQIEEAGFAARRRNFFYEVIDSRPVPAAGSAFPHRGDDGKRERERAIESTVRTLTGGKRPLVGSRIGKRGRD